MLWGGRSLKEKQNVRECIKLQKDESTNTEVSINGCNWEPIKRGYVEKLAEIRKPFL